MYKEPIRPAFATLLKHWPKGKLIRGVEVGVYKCANARAMLESCEYLKLYLVDIFAQPELVELLNAYPHSIKFIGKSSVEAAKTFADGMFDFVYIDADHEYESILTDLKSWYPKLKEKGRLAGHDWGKKGVSKAVIEFSKDIGRRICIEHSDWWLK